MDQAQALLRSITRAFYGAEHILIMDAVLLHWALRDDDLAHLMGQQVKHLRRLCNKLREDGLLYVHSRPETREGANRPINRDYYWVDVHRAIDVVKFRVKSMVREVERRYGQSVEEKKEYRCPQCRMEYTQMEVLDNLDPFSGGFVCKRCSHLLESVVDESGSMQSAGHEVQSRLNAQMAVFENIMRKIDDADVPENTFDAAIAKALPVRRDESVNPSVRTEPVDRKVGNLPPATVHGLRTEPEKVNVLLLDEEMLAEQRRLDAEKKRKAAEQNALPLWHTQSTVSGSGSQVNGASVANSASHVNGILPKKEDDSEEKKFDKAVEEEIDMEKVNQQELDDYYKDLQEAGDEDEEDEDESDDSGESEDEAEATPSSKRGADTPASDERPQKRVKIEEPVVNGTLNGATPGESAEDDSDAE